MCKFVEQKRKKKQLIINFYQHNYYNYAYSYHVVYVVGRVNTMHVCLACEACITCNHCASDVACMILYMYCITIIMDLQPMHPTW